MEKLNQIFDWLLEFLFVTLPKVSGYNWAWNRALPIMDRAQKFFIWTFLLVAGAYYVYLIRTLSPYVGVSNQIDFSPEMMWTWFGYAVIGLFAAPFFVWAYIQKHASTTDERDESIDTNSQSGWLKNKRPFTPGSGVSATLLTLFWVFTPYALCIVVASPGQSQRHEVSRCSAEFTSRCDRLAAGEAPAKALGTVDPMAMIDGMAQCVSGCNLTDADLNDLHAKTSGSSNLSQAEAKRIVDEWHAKRFR